MSLEKLYNTINELADQVKDEKIIPMQKIEISSAVLQLAQAFQIMKDLEIHEKFHTESGGGVDGFRPLPGERIDDFGASN